MWHIFNRIYPTQLSPDVCRLLTSFCQSPSDKSGSFSHMKRPVFKSCFVFVVVYPKSRLQSWGLPALEIKTVTQNRKSKDCVMKSDQHNEQCLIHEREMSANERRCAGRWESWMKCSRKNSTGWTPFGCFSFRMMLYIMQHGVKPFLMI